MTTMENEKREITRIALKYEKVQNLMKYVNENTLKEMYKRQPKNNGTMSRKRTPKIDKF